jgi:hypothetical protein
MEETRNTKGSLLSVSHLWHLHRWDAIDGYTNAIIGRLQCWVEPDAEFFLHHPELTPPKNYQVDWVDSSMCILEVKDSVIVTDCQAGHGLVVTNDLGFQNSHGEDEWLLDDKDLIKSRTAFESKQIFAL